jgi:hypothetical protein
MLVVTSPMTFLASLNLDNNAQAFVAFSNRYLFNSDFGEKMGMKFHTLNATNACALLSRFNDAKNFSK